MDVRFYRYPPDGLIHISMQQCGDKTTIIDEFVDEESPYDQWKRRFPEEWKAFQDGTSQTPSEQSLDYCPWIDYGTRKELNNSGIFALPQLARVSEAGIEQLGIPMIRHLIRRAQAEVEEYRAEMDRKQTEAKQDAKTLALEKEVADLRAKLQAALVPEAPPPPPPPKQARKSAAAG